MEERKVRDISEKVHVYWKDIIRVAKIYDELLSASIWDCDYDLLDIVIKSFTPQELANALSDHEETKFYAMQKIWYRYMDIKEGRSNLVNNVYIEITADSSITELDLTVETLKLLKQLGVSYLWQVSDAISEHLPYECAIDAASAIAILDKRRYLC